MRSSLRRSSSAGTDPFTACIALAPVVVDHFYTIGVSILKAKDDAPAAGDD